jgi:hypothetical protein
MQDELVGMLGLNAECSNYVGGEIAQIHCDDHICLATNGRCQDMSVVRIGEAKAGDRILVAGYQSVDRM